jgi:hypothetical protein
MDLRYSFKYLTVRCPINRDIKNCYTPWLLFPAIQVYFKGIVYNIKKKYDSEANL